MRLGKAFFGEEYSKINMIIDSFAQMQSDYINLIASASYPFPNVSRAQGIPLQILPIEGFIGSRFFPPYKCMDDLEIFGEEETLKLFKNPEGYRANIQPHSGTQANQIVYNAILKDGDVVLSMDPNSGGHISHKKMAGRSINVIHYSVDNNGIINYHEIEELTIKHSPKLIIAGSSSYPREIDYEIIGKIAEKYNSMLMTDICHSALFIATNLHKSVFPYADFVTFSLEKNLRGPQGGIIIYRNKYYNQIAKSTFPVSQGGPIQSLMIAKLFALETLNFINLNEYAFNIVSNSKKIVERLVKNKIKLITNGTDSHIILLDISKNYLSGREIEQFFFNNKLLVNKNLIPHDKRSPLNPSGIRMATTCITILGYSDTDLIGLADIITNIINHKSQLSQVQELANKYNKSLIPPVW